MRSFSAKEKDLGTKEGKFTFELAPHQTAWVQTTVEAIFDNEEPIRTFESGFATELDKADQAYKSWLSSVAYIRTNDADTNKIIERSYRDLYMLRLPTAHGMAVAAGIPWYAVPFGRDQIITAWKMLELMPEMARDVISLLAYHMGTTTNTSREEEPGRIMHELRSGEMARLKEIPFVPYFGTVDATPLFVILFTDYCKQTNDLSFAKEHWDKVKRALSYLDTESDNGKKYLVYGKVANQALSNQGWKDSGDSITNKDGSLGRPPIAVCEVQGYLYKAWLNVADLAEALQEKE
jgi:glycogen debranching enzyme